MSVLLCPADSDAFMITVQHLSCIKQIIFQFWLVDDRLVYNYIHTKAGFPVNLAVT